MIFSRRASWAAPSKEACVSVIAFALSLTLRLYEAYGTLGIDEVIERMRARRAREEAREEGEP